MKTVFGALLALVLLTACESRAPVQAIDMRATPQGPLALAGGEKVFSWPELRSGDCTLRPGSRLSLSDLGNAGWSGTVWSTDPGDRWEVWFEAFAANEWPLFTLPDRSADPQAVFKKEIEAARTDYMWQESARFDPTKYRHVDTVRLHYSC